MTEPNKEHLKIISQITGDSPIVLHLSVEETLRCMKILQDEIDELRAENMKLSNQLKGALEVMMINKEPIITEHKLRELKNAKNPE